MSHAEKCPVCGGAGTVQKITIDSYPIECDCTCHGCAGTGWVTVTDPYPTPSTCNLPVCTCHRKSWGKVILDIPCPVHG